MEQYAKIQQILKKEEGQKERKPIYPPTVIQAVFDAKTGASLEAILAQFNSIYVQYQGTPQATRCIIPEEMRRAGLTITYMNMDSETITERAASAVQKDNDHWGLDINWSRVDELSLSGDISVSAQGTWIINGEDTGIKALGPKGDAGLTPWLKTIDNRLHFSYDNVNWEPCSEPIAAYFRFNATSGNTQSGTIGKIQISRDNKTWNDLSPEFTNNLHIAGYVATTSALPANKPVGTIYGVGPTYATEDTDQTNPIYRLYVYNGTTWVDNGLFTSIAAGVVQETGDSETEVMSQKAVSEKLTELASKVISQNVTHTYTQNDYATRFGINFKAGQIVTIKAYTEETQLSIYGNVSLSDGTLKYPGIHVSNGKGEVTFQYDVDGTIGNFGFPEPPNKDIIINYKVYVYEESSAPLGLKVDKIDERVSEAENNIKKIDKKVDDIYNEIVVPQNVTHIYNPNNYVINFGINFKAGQIVTIKAYTEETQLSIYGNVSLSDGTLKYPGIHVSNGKGEVTFQYDKDGTISGFGFPNAPTKDLTVNYQVYVYEEGSIPLENLIRDVENIKKNPISIDFDKLNSINENPISNIRMIPGMTAIFRNWGFIGDSLSSGEMECYLNGVLKYIDFYEYSWGQHLCRLCGSIGYNYSSGGQTAKGWLNSTNRAWGQAKSEPKDAYIIALGVNDEYRLNSVYNNGVGSVDSINTDNYENNDYETFAGCYGGIIQRLQEIQPKCKIFVVTMPNESSLNKVIKDIATLFSNVYIIDMATYAIDIYAQSDFRNKYYLNGHLNPSGYLYTAYLFMTYIDWIIRNNPSKFKDVALIGTEYTIV